MIKANCKSIRFLGLSIGASIVLTNPSLSYKSCCYEHSNTESRLQVYFQKTICSVKNAKVIVAGESSPWVLPQKFGSERSSIFPEPDQTMADCPQLL